MNPAATTFRDSRGSQVRLGAELGSGGEGAVYEVVGKPDSVAKIYHRPPTTEKVAKVLTMAAMKTEGLLSLAAWPIDLLKTESDMPAGVLMPKVAGFRDIHTLYSPRNRKADFPNADWKFLIRTASNLARAFAAVHSTGCVIGDVNQGGVRVSIQALVKLIDCDSFQVVAGGRKFLCEVGIAMFTPPELQGRSFHGVTRTTNHDNFGLAILIFHLLCMGRHPFAGRFLGPGDMSIERAIEECRFAYGAGRAGVQMDTPPNALPLAALSNPIAQLFERAFARQAAGSGARPSAAEWVGALDRLETQLKTCSNNCLHQFYGQLSSCPWCKMENASGVIFFNLFVRPLSQGQLLFDLDVVWRRIESVPRPPLPGEEPGPGDVRGVAADPSIRARARHRRVKKFVGVSAAAVCAAILAKVAPGALGYWVLAMLAVCAAIVRVKSAEVVQLKSVLVMAEAQYNAAKQILSTICSSNVFEDKLQELRKAKEDWKNLNELRGRRYSELHASRERQQLQHYLESTYIERTYILGIGRGRKAMLHSYNIETAWDVSEAAVRRVPGFGDTNVARMITWRRCVEQMFRFDAKKGVDPKDVVALDQELLISRQPLEQKLLSGPGQLTQYSHQRAVQITAAESQLKQALQTKLHAAANLRAAT
jgi:DNA-binding helix-hairpin-helix protein with protein kinase domain